MNTALDNTRVGLCAACAHARVIRHPRGGPDYWRCTRAETDPRYTKYPRLPILRCPGFEQKPVEPAKGRCVP